MIDVEAILKPKGETICVWYQRGRLCTRVSCQDREKAHCVSSLM